MTHDHRTDGDGAPAGRTAVRTLGWPTISLTKALRGHGHVVLMRPPGRPARAVVVVTTTTARYPLSPPPPDCLAEAGFVPVTSLHHDDLDRLPTLLDTHVHLNETRFSLQAYRRLSMFLSEVLLHVPPGFWDTIRDQRRVTMLVVHQVAVAKGDRGRGLATAVARGHVLGGHLTADVLPATPAGTRHGTTS